MITSGELKPFKMYSKNTKFLIPSIKEDTKKGSAIFLLTPGLESSIECMQLPYVVNRRMFESYYIEKGIHYLISADKKPVPVSESALSAKKRNSFKDSMFGIPELRKYPLNDESHVRDAVKKFNYVDAEHEKELAMNINKAITRFEIKDLKVGEENRFKKYLPAVEEVEEDMNLYENDVFQYQYSPEYKSNRFGIINNKECFYIANDTITEALSRYDTKIKRIIYADRIRNNNLIKDIYTRITEELPFIRYTKYNLDQYKGRNLFVDTSYYNKAFLENNDFNMDRGVDLYLDFMDRLLDDSRLKKYTKKTVFIPVEGWGLKLANEYNDIMDVRNNINPISVIYRCAKKNKFDELRKVFGRYNVIFVGASGYFRMDFATFERKYLNKFVLNINTILSRQPIQDEERINGDSKEAIATMIYNNIQSNTGISFKKNFVGSAGDFKMKSGDTISSRNSFATAPEDYDDDDEDEDSEEVSASKDYLAMAIDDIADSTSSLDELEIDPDLANNIARIIDDIASEKGSNGIDISAARASRISRLDADFVNKGMVHGVKVIDLLKDADATKTDETIKETALPIHSINDEWQHMKFMNFEKHYNLDADIVAILRFFSSRTYPVSVVRMDVEDTSNSENFINTWTVVFEDVNGTRFTMKFDVPKFVEGTRFMRLRGNDKTINGQLMNIPVVKTDQDTCQITSNYNKIFIRPYGSSAGKSNVAADRLMKAIMKYQGNEIKYDVGDNTKLADKYELPIDYIDLGGQFSKIETPYFIFYFNQDDLYAKYGNDIELAKKGRAMNNEPGVPIGVCKPGIRRVHSQYDDGDIIFTHGSDSQFVASQIAALIGMDVPDFKDLYESFKPATKYRYSKCSILNTEIPLIVVAGYASGLSAIMKKINYRKNKKYNDNSVRFEDSPNYRYDSIYYDAIRFKDATLVYELSYTNSMLFNGLKECPTEDYSIADIDNRAMWTDFLDCFGGRIKADGLDNFFDLMIDPITKRVCSVYGLPDDYVDQLIYANALLSDSKYSRHTDLRSNRFRTNELVAAYTFKCLATAYSDYSIKVKKTGSGIMSMKQSAIIDAILADNTTSDLSTNSDLSYVETANTVSFKGLSGLNCDRSYGIDKRAYDDSMVNVLAMSTGFAGNVGVNRNTTIDMGIESSRGYITGKANSKSNMNVTNTLSISEAIMPMSSTKDDPFRLAMSFIQNSKHGIAGAVGDPCLVTTGADDALPYQAPDVFNYKAKKPGRVLDINDRFMTLRYNDGTTEVIELHPKTYKNSDGGFYLSIKLDVMPGIKVGSTFKELQVLAYDPKSYSPNVGWDNNPTANRGVLGKVAFELTDEGFEDSGLTSAYCSKAMSRKVTVKIDCALDKNTNVYDMVSVGTHVEEGENLLVYQNAFDDDDVNALLRKLTDSNESVSDLGRHPKKAKVTGDIVDIQIYRTCELDELSPTLKKIVSKYEAEIEKDKQFLKEYDKNKAQILRSNYKLENTGKLKNLEDGVLIEFYLEFITDFGAGDKLVVNGGNKCVTSGSIEAGKEAYSAFRPDEPIDLLTSINSNNARMITSNFLIGLCSKAVIELDRQVKGIMGHKVETDIHKYLHPEMIDPKTKEVFDNRKK